ncbi:MAG: hypothetical protein H6740_01365 [Alphaproteobacteria bacterium]|nr:hypothetical protein [Alphaproteobacteria bacterium]
MLSEPVRVARRLYPASDVHEQGAGVRLSETISMAVSPVSSPLSSALVSPLSSRREDSRMTPGPVSSTASPDPLQAKRRRSRARSTEDSGVRGR